MNKQEFLQRLESGLAGVAPDEKVAAVQFYTEYFDDAGPESEQAVLAELGSPDTLAADIKAVSELVEETAEPAAEAPVLEAEEVTIVQDPFDMAEVPAAPDIPAAPEKPAAPAEAAPAAGEATPADANSQPTADGVPPQYRFPGGYVPPRYGVQAQGTPYYGQQGQPYPGAQNPGAAQQPMYTQRPASGGADGIIKVIVTILLVMLFPAIIGIGIAILVILLIPFIIGAAFLFSAAIIFFAALLLIGVHIGSGLMLIGISLLFLAGGLALCWAGIKIFIKGLPACFRGIGRMFSAVYGRKREA